MKIKKLRDPGLTNKLIKNAVVMVTQVIVLP